MTQRTRHSGPCRTWPSRCMNDLCRWSDVGICGNEEPIPTLDDEWDDYLYEVESADRMAFGGWS